MLEWLLGSKDKRGNDITDKAKAENQRVMAGLSELASRLGVHEAQMNQDHAAKARFLARLRKEGGGT